MQSVDILLETTRQFMFQVAAFMPRLLVALAVVAGGWVLAKAARFAVEKALWAINFNVLSERAGIDGFLHQGGMPGGITSVFGLIAYWVVILAALIIGFNSIGLNYITDLLGRLMLFVPKVIVALLIIVFGAYFARFAGDAVQRHCIEANIRDADMLGMLAHYAIVVFVVMIALSQVEIGGDIVQKTFLILLAGVVFALALAFGLGGKEWAATLLQHWWPSRDKGDSDGRGGNP